jgi:hypothetical protein
VKLRQRAHHPAIAFLGPGGAQVVRAQSGFDVTDLHPVVKGGQRRSQGGGGIAMHERVVGPVAVENTAQAQHRARRDVGEILPRPHDVEIEVGTDAEKLETLVEHLPVLRGHADPGIEAGVCIQRRDHGRHLDCLGTRADDR